MQERHVLERPPRAAVGPVGAVQVERARDLPAVAFGEDQQHIVRHRLAEQREEGAGKVWAPPFARARILIKGPECVPMRLGDGVARQMAVRQPSDCGGAFVTDRLALARGELDKEIRSEEKTSELQSLMRI